MPTFCRHGRFLERCPICSKTLPDAASGSGAGTRAKTSKRSSPKGHGAGRTHARTERMRVRREGRSEDDGYRCELVPGIRASADALKLVEELSFASGRLRALASDPPGLYAEARSLAADDPERASWICFLIAYLSPLEGESPFSGIELALTRMPALPPEAAIPPFDGIPLGPRSVHEQERGTEGCRPTPSGSRAQVRARRREL